MSTHIIIDPPLDGLDPVHRITVRMADGLSNIELVARGVDPDSVGRLLAQVVDEVTDRLDALFPSREEQTERWRNG